MISLTTQDFNSPKVVSMKLIKQLKVKVKLARKEKEDMLIKIKNNFAPEKEAYAKYLLETYRKDLIEKAKNQVEINLDFVEGKFTKSKRTDLKGNTEIMLEYLETVLLNLEVSILKNYYLLETERINKEKDQREYNDPNINYVKLK